MLSPSYLNENRNEIPNPAGLLYSDLRSLGCGKFNTNKPTFAKLPSNKGAIHDMRTVFQAYTMESPLPDSGGKKMKLAARTFDANNPNQLVIQCFNVPRNIFNKGYCVVSYDLDACMSNPLYYGNDQISSYLTCFAGPDNSGIVVCGSENEVAPIATEDNGYNVANGKVQSHCIDYNAQKQDIWMERKFGLFHKPRLNEIAYLTFAKHVPFHQSILVAVDAKDQFCQRMAFTLSKIFCRYAEH